MEDNRPLKEQLKEAVLAVPQNAALITYLQTERNAEIAKGIFICSA